MVCTDCKLKSECDYYKSNIEPVLNTEQASILTTSDEYLLQLHRALESFKCDYFE